MPPCAWLQNELTVPCPAWATTPVSAPPRAIAAEQPTPFAQAAAQSDNPVADCLAALKMSVRLHPDCAGDASRTIAATIAAPRVRQPPQRAMIVAPRPPGPCDTTLL